MAPSQAARAPETACGLESLAADVSPEMFGCYGCPDAKTPTLDRMAEERVMFRTACGSSRDGRGYHRAEDDPGLAADDRKLVEEASGSANARGPFGRLLARDVVTPAPAQSPTLAGLRPNIVLVLTDDQGYGDLSAGAAPSSAGW